MPAKIREINSELNAERGRCLSMWTDLTAERACARESALRGP